MTRGSEEIASNEFRTSFSMGTTDCCANTDGWSELSSAAKLRAKKTVLILKDNSDLLKYSHTKTSASVYKSVFIISSLVHLELTLARKAKCALP